jgi:hypothetical protein
MFEEWYSKQRMTAVSERRLQGKNPADNLTAVEEVWLF